MSFQLNLSGHTASKEAEAEVVKILHKAKEDIVKVASEVFAVLNTQHHGSGSTTEVVGNVETDAVPDTTTGGQVFSSQEPPDGGTPAT